MTIVTALDDIGEALSRVDLAESLYPTEKMKNVIVSLNCHIITFLCRALDWYRSGSLSRTMQSITRPAALRYDDLIRDINKTLSQVTDLSQAGSQAEQRDMHEEMRQEYHAQKDFRSVVQHRLDEMGYQLNSLVQHKYIDGEFKLVHQQIQEVKALVKTISEKQMSSEQTLLQALLLTKQDIQATQVDIRNQISEVQLNQALSFVLAKCAINHQAAYESAFGQRRARRAIAGKCAPFWNSQQFQQWDQLDTHNIIVLVLSRRDRLSVRDFYIGIIEQLITSHVPAFWIIEQRYDTHRKEHKHGIFEVLRSLVAQTLKAALLETDVALSSQIRTFEAARTIEEYTSILVHSLSRFKLAYLFLDANAILPEYVEECHCVLRKIPDLVREHNTLTVLKIMILSPGLSRGTPVGDGRQSAVVKIGQTSKGKSRKVPQSPLRGNKTRFASLRQRAGEGSIQIGSAFSHQSS